MNCNVNLPPLWSWVKLGDVCEKIIGGGTPSTKIDSYWSGKIPWITSADIHGTKKIIPRKFITAQAIKESATNLLPKENIIVVTRVGLGKLARNDFDLCFSQDSQGLVLNKKIIDKNYALIILSKAVQEFKIHNRGTTISGVTKKQLSELSIPLPPLPEQEKIVDMIEELFSGLDSGVASLKKAKEQLRIYRQSLLAFAFSGRLTGNVNDETKNGELPDGWKWESLKELTSLLGDGLHGTPKYTEDGDYYFINGNNLSEGKIEIKANTKRVAFEEYEKYKKPLNDRTVFVSINGTLGKTAFYNQEKIILGKSACYFNLKENADKRYVRYYITTQRFLNYANETATGSTIKNVSLQAMRDFNIPLPPSIKEQIQIVEEIEKRFSEADNLEKAIDDSLTKAETLRQSILKRAFEGHLVS
jgi:type I restriction enzyme, S subunit